ncbi:MAG TPA: antitoxin family protein [Thermoguttaceae bacterium]|nr:antitoxin family protein [Thermoguttaceae bacterium]
MSQIVKAIYQNGVLKPLERLDLEEHEQVRITVESLPHHSAKSEAQDGADPLEGVRAATGIPDLAEHFDDYRFGRRRP